MIYSNRLRSKLSAEEGLVIDTVLAKLPQIAASIPNKIHEQASLCFDYFTQLDGLTEG